MVRAKSSKVATPLTDRQLDLIVRSVERLPIVAPVARGMLDLVLNDSRLAGQQNLLMQAHRLARLDISLTFSLLSQANSRPCAALKRRLAGGADPGDRCGQDAGAAGGACAMTVGQALDAVGYEPLRAMVLSNTVLDAIAGQGAAVGPLPLADFWRHSLAVGLACRQIARIAHIPVDLEEAFTCGLLHDVGKLAMHAALPKGYARVMAADKTRTANISQHEQETVGADHAAFGRRLAEHWRLGQTLTNVIWLHHQPAGVLAEDLPERPLVLMVAVADAIARKADIGYSGNHSATDIAAPASELGLSQQDIADIAAGLADQVQAEIDDAAGELAASTDTRGPDARGTFAPTAIPAGAAVGQQALLQAATELARQNAQLAARVEQFAAQARAMDCLARFTAAISADTTVPAVLEQIVLAAAECLAAGASAAGPLVAYCLDSGTAAPEALAVIHHGGQALTWRTLPCNATAETLHDAARENRAAPAGELLFGADGASDITDLSAMTHLPLIAGGQLVGGVFVQKWDSAQRAGSASSAEPGPAFVPQRQDGDRHHQTAAEPVTCDLSPILPVLAMSLAIVQGRGRAVHMGERLANASAVLAEASTAISEARTVAAIGDMAAGAAHELNNPLAVISGRAQIMRTKAASPDDRKAWQSIADQAQRISNIITDLMEFARPTPPVPQAISAAALLQSAAKAYGELSDAKASAAKVDIQVEPDLPSLYVDARQVQAVLVELLRNATAASQTPHVMMRAQLDEHDGRAMVSIIDTGSGMDDTTLAAAFTPFFSSQPSGRRRGLGLPLARRRIEINGGDIRIASRAGQGTAVHVRLPVASQQDETNEDRS